MKTTLIRGFLIAALLAWGAIAHSVPHSPRQFGYSRTDALVAGIAAKERKVTFQPIGRGNYKPSEAWFWVADDVVFSRQRENGPKRRATLRDIRVGDRVLLSAPGGISNDGQATEVIILKYIK